MRMRNTAIAGLAAALLTVSAPVGIAASTDDPDTISAEIRQSIEEFQEYTAAQSDEALEAGETLLERIDRELAAIDERLEEAGEEASQEWREQKMALEERREDIAARLEELRESSEADWERFQDAVVEAYYDFVDALSDFWEELQI